MIFNENGPKIDKNRENRVTNEFYAPAWGLVENMLRNE